jgi:hypothetical protein
MDKSVELHLLEIGKLRKRGYDPFNGADPFFSESIMGHLADIANIQERRISALEQELAQKGIDKPTKR